jgi:Mg2+-importing ATPase
VLVENAKGRLLISKGAYESILSVSDSVLIEGKAVVINNDIRNNLNALIDKYENSGYRAIVVSKKNFQNKSSSSSDENKMTIVGFLLFKDPVKSTTKEAIRKLTDLGVNLKYSGDLTVTTNVLKRRVLFLINQK